VPGLFLAALLLLGADLRGAKVFDTGVFVCDAQPHVLEWRNPTGAPLRLKKLAIWMGMGRKGIADYEGTVYRISDGSLVASFAWDHYGEPNGPHTLVQDFAPDWMDLAAGDGLRLWSWCDDFGEGARESGPGPERVVGSEPVGGDALHGLLGDDGRRALVGVARAAEAHPLEDLSDRAHAVAGLELENGAPALGRLHLEEPPRGVAAAAWGRVEERHAVASGDGSGREERREDEGGDDE